MNLDSIRSILPNFQMCNFNMFIKKLVDCLEKCLIYGHIRRVAD